MTTFQDIWGIREILWHEKSSNPKHYRIQKVCVAFPNFHFIQIFTNVQTNPNTTLIRHVSCINHYLWWFGKAFRDDTNNLPSLKAYVLRALNNFSILNWNLVKFSAIGNGWREKDCKTFQLKLLNKISLLFQLQKYLDRKSIRSVVSVEHLNLDSNWWLPFLKAQTSTVKTRQTDRWYNLLAVSCNKQGIMAWRWWSTILERVGAVHMPCWKQNSTSGCLCVCSQVLTI